MLGKRKKLFWFYDEQDKEKKKIKINKHKQEVYHNYKANHRQFKLDPEKSIP